MLILIMRNSESSEKITWPTLIGLFSVVVSPPHSLISNMCLIHGCR